MNLLIRADDTDLEYYDVASELARFIYGKPQEDHLVNGIASRLSSSLEVLKRRGIPVDRLMKKPVAQSKRCALRLHTILTDCLFNSALPHARETLVKPPHNKSNAKPPEQIVT